MPRPPEGVYGRGSDELKLVDANGGETDDDAEADDEVDEAYEDDVDSSNALAHLVGGGTAHTRSTIAAAATESVRLRIAFDEFGESERSENRGELYSQSYILSSAVRAR